MRRLSLVYAFGVWLSLTTWAALWPLVAPLLGRQMHGKGDGVYWAAAFNAIPGLLALLGFLLGSITFGPAYKAYSPVRPALSALGIGLLFPLTLLVLRPLFATVSAGLMPAIAWVFLGSFFAALLFGAMFTQR